jgi:putative transposase
MRYQRRVREDEESLRSRLRSLAEDKRGSAVAGGIEGCTCSSRGRSDRFTISNHQRLYRRYREERLALRRRKRVAVPSRGAQEQTWKRGEAWVMDFMQDVLVAGRRFRTLNVLDLLTRECLALEVDTSLPGPRVTRVLDQLVASYGAPQQITVDNGPEFAGQVLDAWAYAHGVALDFIEPGNPTQNAHIESFNGKFPDECLDLQWFGRLAHARAVIQTWKEEYNTARPHSALRWRTPAAFVQSLTT